MQQTRPGDTEGITGANVLKSPLKKACLDLRPCVFPGQFAGRSRWNLFFQRAVKAVRPGIQPRARSHVERYRKNGRRSRRGNAQSVASQFQRPRCERCGPIQRQQPPLGWSAGFVIFWAAKAKVTK